MSKINLVFKYLIYLTFLVFSSCSYSTYNMNKGALKIEQTKTYNVRYLLYIPQQSIANVSFTSENGTQKTLEGISGTWENTVVLKSGQKVFLSLKSFGKKNKEKQIATIFVNQKVVSTKTTQATNASYGLTFILP